ncbi:unnamed protein product [Durusdinium trenchii]|uniref:tRNA:m(4)X modification enzyme TRM13 n=1 Tax=Durusdinium trenchii TaxID=1381693 RepID=A0ABP0S0I1_9DINO
MADPTDDNDIEDWLPVLSFDGFLGEEDGEVASKPSVASRRRQKREERAHVRLAHDKARTRELRAVHQVLQALQEALPNLWSRCSSADSGARQEKKVKHPTEEEVEEALTAAAAALQVECPYRRLPQIFAPQEGLEILSSMIDRPPKYQEKYLAQEWSILAKVWALAPNLGPRSGGLAVVDIGAGNGSLALLAGLLLGGHAVLIDHTLPPEPMRVEARLPEQYRDRILRVTGDVGDLDASREIEPILEKHGIRQVVVIAKHLCGTGTDLALKLLRRWCSNGTRVEVLGAVIATCCMHKINTSEEKEVFADIHSSDSYLRKLTGDKDGLLSLLSVCTRCVAWRTTAGAEASRITEKQIRVAEMFEDLLQQPRLKILQHLFPSATEVAFVPFKQSPQNRCLLAGSELGVRRALATGDAGAGAAGEVLAALASARDSLLAVNGTALDLRPHGMVSTRFDYDGT